MNTVGQGDTNLLASMIHPETFEHPDKDVRFFLEQTEFTPDVVVPIDSEGRMMSPFEAKTGVTLPIVDTQPGKRNGHHPEFFRRWFEHENTPIAAKASRFVRKQKVSMSAHNHYHKWFFGTLYAGEEASLRKVNLELAGYVPQFGVDCDELIPKIIELNPVQRSELREPGVFYTERSSHKKSTIGQFLVNSAINKSVDDETESLIDQFLAIPVAEMVGSPEKTFKKLALTQRIIRKGIAKAIDDINVDYQEALQDKALRIGAPVCAFLVIDEFVGQHVFHYSDILEENLQTLVS